MSRVEVVWDCTFQGYPYHIMPFLNIPISNQSTYVYSNRGLQWPFLSLSSEFELRGRIIWSHACKSISSKVVEESTSLMIVKMEKLQKLVKYFDGIYAYFIFFSCRITHLLDFWNTSKRTISGPFFI